MTQSHGRLKPKQPLQDIQRQICTCHTASSPTVGQGTNESSYFTLDRPGVSRPAHDIGAYQYITIRGRHLLQVFTLAKHL